MDPFSPLDAARRFGRYTRRTGPLVFVAIVLAGSIGASTPEESAFEALAGEFLERYYAVHPVRATRLGIHEHDDRLPELSRRAVQRRIAELDDWLARLRLVDRSRLDADLAFDHRILEHAILAERLEREEIRAWRRDPMIYNRALAEGIASLVDREFAPLDERLENLVGRLRRMPALLDSARANLDEVPAEWTELALRNARGTIEFLGVDVPRALERQGLDRIPSPLRSRWERAHRRTLERLRRFVTWIEKDLTPRADGEFRLGRELFERKLLHEEHVPLNVEELAALNEEAIRYYRDWVAREAARVDPAAPVAEVMQRVIRDHPEPDELISTAKRFVEDAQRVVVERDLVGLPDAPLPEVRPTPEYARSGFASMSAPGPFEDRATEAYYNITGVDRSWTDEQQSEHLTYFNRAGLLGISVHEVMPGHWVQMLYQRRLPTDVRKVFAPSSLVEGWAHYAEQLMVDEGLGDGDPIVRLGQLRRALQRHARWYASLALHTTNTPLDEVSRRFAEIAYFAPFPAARETLRGTYDPTYLYYALGRMQILDLRRDLRDARKRAGRPFSLREFHDRFLTLGLPITLAREALLGDP